MKAYLQQLMRPGRNDLEKLCLAREYLQARILESLQDSGAFMRWAFLGGTALRFLYNLPRFSEDLDFSLLRLGEDPAFAPSLREIHRVFKREGYQVDVEVNKRKTVFSAWIRFPGLMYEAGLAAQPTQVFSVKLELDTNPPPGAGVATAIVRRHVAVNICHYDKASLLAGKLHAILTRTWTKGRDLYDLVWYLADRQWPAPNINLLNAALAQSGWQGTQMSLKNWRETIAEHLKNVNWKAAITDVRPFLEREQDVRLLDRDAVQQLLLGG
jgi:predicted nucleotidyltransferase component of viral defense system